MSLKDGWRPAPTGKRPAMGAASFVAAGCTTESGGSSLRGLGSHLEIHVAIQDMQQGQELIDRLAVVLLIEQTIELRGRCSKPPGHLTF